MFKFISLILLSTLLSVILLLAGALISKKMYLNQMFMSPFECGFFPMETSKVVFSSRFFVMALIFLIFDIELILIFPFICTNQGTGCFPLFMVLIFINILSLGLYYEWNFSMVDWIY